MKHLPNELLYLLKFYKYMTEKIGLDYARSRAEEIREYIEKADYLDSFPTIREYLSPEKSMEDIITYIKRNEKTYSLLSEWKDGEIASILKSIGIEGMINVAEGFELEKDEAGDIYFTLPYKSCIEHKIVLRDADIDSGIRVDDILWLELYKTRENMCLEIFDNNCNTLKVTFSEIECKKIFYLPPEEKLSEGCKSPYDSVVWLCQFINEKYTYDSTILNEKEKALIPAVRFFANADDKDTDFLSSLFNEYRLEKGIKIINSIEKADSERKKLSCEKKLQRYLKSKKSLPLMEKMFLQLIDTQKN